MNDRGTNGQGTSEQERGFVIPGGGMGLRFDPPIDPSMPCWNCGRAVAAIGRLHDPQIPELPMYEWIHRDDGRRECPPLIRTAQVDDRWEATVRIDSIRQERLETRE